MSFCVKCSRKLPEGASFCPNCGAPATPNVAAPRSIDYERLIPSAPPSPPSPEQMETGFRRKRMLPKLFGLWRYIVGTKHLALRGTYEIKDANGNLMGYAKRKIISWGSKFWFEDLEGRELGRVEQKKIALRLTYKIYDSGGKERGEIEKKMMAFKPAYTIKDPGGNVMTFVKGDWSGYEYKFYAPDKKALLAEVSRSISWHSLLSDEHALEIHSERLDPMIALSFDVALRDIERKKKD